MNAWKGVALTLMALMLLVILFNLSRPVAPGNREDSRQQRRADAYMDELEKRNAAYYGKTDELLNRANAIDDLSFSNQKRFEKILERWEKQADRMDRVLARLEKGKEK